MREQERRRLEAAGRERMRSPGRPPAGRREERQRFWAAIARGLPSEDAAVVAGVSPAVGTRWFRQAGGMPPITQSALSGRYLSLAEREEIAILLARGCGVREIARRAVNGPLRRYVEERLAGAVRRPDDGACVDGPDVRWIGRRHGRRADRRWATAWSPEQIANRVRADFPDDDSMRISHEAIYQALYVQGRGALRRELTACLRSGRALRVPRARTTGRGKGFVSPEIMISERPAEAEDRAVPGHWEGDLIIGLNSSAIGTLVERTTRFTMLLHLPRMSGHGGPRKKNGPALAGHGAEAVRDAIAATITTLPGQLRRSLTWDQGAEMASHAQLRTGTGLDIYFCDPHSPWQRGSNENTNEHQRTVAPVLPEGNRPQPAQRRRPRRGCRCAQRPPPQDTRLEDPRRSPRRTPALVPARRNQQAHGARPMPQLKLDVNDAGELAEMLIFLREWLTTDPRLQASLAERIGHPAYGIPQLRDDLHRFIFLLGGNDGEHLFTSHTPEE